MDFIARAGSLIDKSHRVAGFLLILLVVESVLLINSMNRNGQLVDRIYTMSERLPVYVVPGSQTGVYSPTQDDLLIGAFVDLITQSLNSYTYETVEEQYQEARSFFTSEMLAFSQDYFDRLIKNVGSDRRSSLFIPHRQSLKIEKGKENGIDIRQVKVRGSLQQILAGSVVETVPLEITLKLQKTTVSKTNPFGFMLSKYFTKQLDDR